MFHNGIKFLKEIVLLSAMLPLSQVSFADTSVLQLDSLGSQALGVDRGEIALWNHAKIDDDGFQLLIRDRRHPITSATDQVIIRISSAINGCYFALPGSDMALFGIVGGTRCQLQSRTGYIRFQRDESFTPIKFNFNQSSEDITIPADAEILEFYLVDDVKQQSSCRISYSGTYPSYVCGEPLGATETVYVSNFGTNYQIALER
ncbi:MAG: hypothetical protein HRU19_12495 [Pseudobacteriovorax sp.]|nr:hypothetical protein [Pseudobacteriovorax sp.]